MLKFVIEFIGIFIILFMVYYFFIIRKCKNNTGYVPVEVNLILSRHRIDVKKINLYQMIKQVSIVTVLILTLTISIITNFFDSVVLAIIFATLLSVLLAFIIYGFIGQYYEKKCEKKQK